MIGFQEIFSQAALRDALALTRHYRDAVQVGFDPAPDAPRLTPSVALVSRLPLAAPGTAHAGFPAGVALADGGQEADRFSRAVIHAAVVVAPDCTVVLGDFNDIIDSVSTQIVLGAGSTASGRHFDACQLQRRRDQMRHVGFSMLSEGNYTTIDHILVSEHFNANLPNAIGEVVDVIYLNDHLVLELPEASDHGQVVARVRLFDETRGLSDAGL